MPTGGVKVVEEQAMKLLQQLRSHLEQSLEQLRYTFQQPRQHIQLAGLRHGNAPSCQAVFRHGPSRKGR